MQVNNHGMFYQLPIDTSWKITQFLTFQERSCIQRINLATHALMNADNAFQDYRSGRAQRRFQQIVTRVIQSPQRQFHIWNRRGARLTPQIFNGITWISVNIFFARYLMPTLFAGLSLDGYTNRAIGGAILALSNYLSLRHRNWILLQFPIGLGMLPNSIGLANFVNELFFSREESRMRVRQMFLIPALSLFTATLLAIFYKIMYDHTANRTAVRQITGLVVGSAFAVKSSLVRLYREKFRRPNN